MLAAIGDTGFNLVLLGHLVAIILGMGAALWLPAVVARAVTISVAEDLRRQASAVVAPALFVGGVLGGGLVALSGDAYDFGQTWLILATIGWVASVLCAALALPPNYFHIATIGTVMRARFMVGLHLALALQLVVMVWKPGL